MDQDAAWYGGRGLGPGDIVLDTDAAILHAHFSVHVYCGHTAGWIRTPLDTEVCLGPDDIVLVKWIPSSAAHKKRHSSPPMSIVVKWSPVSATAELLLK